MTIDLYFGYGGASSRAVLLTAAAVGVELNLKPTNLMNGEHLRPEFLKINPQHTIPTLDDNGFHLWESRAIAGYLVDKYAKDDSLYPKDAQARAVVNQRLYFDMETLYKSFAECYYPVIMSNASLSQADPAKVEKINQAFEYLEKFLEGQTYVAGTNLTIADLSLACSVSTFLWVNYDLSKYKNVLRWYATVKSEAPKFEETTRAGYESFQEFIDNRKK